MMKAIVVLVAALVASSAKADLQDLWVLGERISGMPSKVLYSMALTESGMTVKGVRQPYPWTLNINSTPPKSLRFQSRQEAEAQLKELVGNGITNIDIGLMQVNLKYHGHSVKSPSDLLDPKINVMVASLFIRELLAETQDIGKSIANYHSRTATLGDNYKRLVFDNLVNISR